MGRFQAIFQDDVSAVNQDRIRKCFIKTYEENKSYFT